MIDGSFDGEDADTDYESEYEILTNKLSHHQN